MVYSNQVGRGVVQACSGNGYAVNGDHQIRIEGNSFADNQYQIYFWSQIGPEPTRGLGETLVTRNTIWGWIYMGFHGGGTEGGPGAYGVTMSHNVYSSGHASEDVWGRWDYYRDVAGHSLADLHDALHLEDGTSVQKDLGRFPGQLPAGTIHASPTLAEVQAHKPNPAPAESEIDTPSSRIDDELAGLPSRQAVHAPAIISVFGHTPLVVSGDGGSICEVYDLQGRWVDLAVPASQIVHFKEAVLPYATLKGTAIHVVVTWKSPYRVSAQYSIRPWLTASV